MSPADQYPVILSSTISALAECSVNKMKIKIKTKRANLADLFDGRIRDLIFTKLLLNLSVTCRDSCSPT